MSSSSWHNDTANDARPSLAGWLSNLTVNLPDETFHKGIFSVSLKNVSCSQYQISSIKSNYTDSSSEDDDDDDDDDDPCIQLSVYGVSATCVGTYRCGISSGNVFIQLTSHSPSNNNNNNNKDNIDKEDESIFLEITVPSVDYYWNSTSDSTRQVMRMPHSANITTCFVHNLQVDRHDGIYFSGSISAAFIELFSRMIAKRITHSLTVQLCPFISKGIDTLLTQHVIQPMNQYFIPLITNQTIMPSSLNLTRTEITWDSDIPLLKKTLMDVNQYLSHHMDKGILLSWLDHTIPCETDCGYFFFNGINGFLRQWTPNMNGTFTFPTNINATQPSLFHLPFQIPHYGNVHIYGRSMQITGLTSLEKLILAYPVQSQYVHWNFSTAQGLDILAELYIRIEPWGVNQDNVLEETFTVHIHSSNVTFSTTLSLSVERSQFEQIVMGDILNHLGHSSKVWIPFLGLNEAFMTRLEVNASIQTMDIHPFESHSFLRTLEGDCDDLLNTLTQFVLREYSVYVSKALYALADGPVKLTLNKMMEQYILNSTMSRRSSPRFEQIIHLDLIEEMEYKQSYLPGVFDWNMSTMSLKKLNSFIECVLQSITLASNQALFPLDIMNLWNDEFLLKMISWEIQNVGRMNQIGELGMTRYFFTLFDFAYLISSSCCFFFFLSLRQSRISKLHGEWCSECITV